MTDRYIAHSMRIHVILAVIFVYYMTLFIIMYIMLYKRKIIKLKCMWERPALVVTLCRYLFFTNVKMKQLFSKGWCSRLIIVL